MWPNCAKGLLKLLKLIERNKITIIYKSEQQAVLYLHCSIHCYKWLLPSANIMRHSRQIVPDICMETSNERGCLQLIKHVWWHNSWNKMVSKLIRYEWAIIFLIKGMGLAKNYYQKIPILTRWNAGWNSTRQKRLAVGLMVHRSLELVGIVSEPTWIFLINKYISDYN